MISAGELKVVNSSIINHGSVSYKTIDKVVQEDARQLTLDGSAKAGIQFFSKSHFREDLRAHLDAKSALSLTLKVNHKPTQPLDVGMVCQDDCGASLDISPLLMDELVGKWQTITIDLACFKKAGVDFGQMISPFGLESSEKITVSFADIRFVPGVTASADKSCQ